jgi:hypothetical protein
MLLEAAFNLLGVLAALNRVYYARFELKRLRRLVAKLPLASPELADRLESLFRLPPAEAADELGKLVVETRELSRGSSPSSSCRYGVRREPVRKRGRSRSVLSTTMSASDSGSTSSR